VRARRVHREIEKNLVTSTLDFSLSDEEKTFLLARGRATALQFLLRKGHVKQAEVVDEAINLAEQHKVAALTARKKRTFRTKFIFRSLLIIGLLLLLAWKFGSHGRWFTAGKIANAYSTVCKALQSCAEPELVWVESSVAYVGHAVATDTAFTFADLPPVPATGAVLGSQRYGEPKAAFAPLIKDAWKLHNGEIVLDEDPLIQSGRISPSWVGEPEPPDWNRFNGMVLARFGFTPDFANNNRCSKAIIASCHRLKSSRTQSRLQSP
jgi:hypothetical protein